MTEQPHPLDALRADYPDWTIGEHYHASVSGPGVTIYTATRDGICVTALQIPSLREHLADAGRAKSARRLRVIRGES